MKLLTYFLAIVSLCTFSFKAFAVGGSYGGSSGTALGILGGYRFNNLEFPANRSYDRTERSTPGYQVGLLIFLPVTDSVSLRLGALYVTRDMEFTATRSNPIFNGKTRLNYIDLPATLQVTLFGSPFYTWFGQMLGVKATEGCDINPGTNNCGGLGGSAAPFDISSVLGFGWNIFDIGSSGKFSIEAEYEYGMNNIFPAFQTNTTGFVANAILKFGI